ncbi:MATE family efflux transporter [Eggerthia catenaformis]|uniref:MATE family efflux transporter n=1 Tax=Eggerthia catenaformis TaxID=31973 RepID=UPI00047BF8B8|nr:MATE family efflux transporter [Eggerthia catenaformis]
MIIANKRGVEVAAAVGIVEKIISFLFIIPSTMMSAVSTISSQSIGAGKKELARKVLFIGIGIAAGIGFVFALSLQFVSEYVIGLFTSEKQVIILGT